MAGRHISVTRVAGSNTKLMGNGGQRASVQSISWQRLTVRGEAAHAGNTPIHTRHDAGPVAAQVVDELRRMCGSSDFGQLRATVGNFDIAPKQTKCHPARGHHHHRSAQPRRRPDDRRRTVPGLLRRWDRGPPRCADLLGADGQSGTLPASTPGPTPAPTAPTSWPTPFFDWPTSRSRLRFATRVDCRPRANPFGSRASRPACVDRRRDRAAAMGSQTIAAGGWCARTSSVMPRVDTAALPASWPS